jgi:hypothetical protein
MVEYVLTGVSKHHSQPARSARRNEPSHIFYTENTRRTTQATHRFKPCSAYIAHSSRSLET